MFRVHTPIIRSIGCWVAAYGFLHRVFGWVVVWWCRATESHGTIRPPPMYCTFIPTDSVKSSYVGMDYNSPYNNTIQAYSSGGIDPHILILGARWSGWSQQRPKHLNSVKEPWTHPRGGCVGSNVGLNGCWEEKISCPHRGLYSGPSSP